MKKMKVFTSILSAAILTATSVIGASAAHYKGDVDRDDDVTINDVVTVQNSFVGKGNIENDKKIYVDMNEDGKYNVFDLILMKRVVIGEAPMEEVPSLTTPPETTTTTTTTTTVVTTTPVTTTEEETTTTTKATEETTTTTKATEEITTTTEATEETTTTTKATEETTTTTKATEETTTTTVSSNDKEIITTAIVLEKSGLESMPLDSTKEIDYMELQLGTEKDFKLHVYIDNWSMWVNISCENGVLSQTGTESMIESVTINGDKAIIKFKEGLKGETLYFKNDYSIENIDIISVKVVMAGNGDVPVETSVTEKPEETTTTKATSQETTETSAVSTEETTVTSEISTIETTTTVTSDKSEEVSGTVEVEPNGDVKVDLDSEKEVDSISITLDTTNDFYFHFYLGNWDSWFNIECKDGVLTYNDDNKNIESIEIKENQVVVKFTEGMKVSSATFHQNNGQENIKVIDYTIKMK